MNLKRIDHFVITTAHPEECLRFYQAIGLKLQEAKGRFELIGGNFKLNVHILEKELHPHAHSICPGSADICFEVDSDLDTIVHKLAIHGIQPEMDVSRRHGFFGEMNSIYLRDPDGNLVELCQYEEKERA
jgi:catechol 2,3-dioxygenase-like lactoylglutathione lyase family enzyme